MWNFCFGLEEKQLLCFELCFWQLFSEESNCVELSTLPILFPGALYFALIMSQLVSGNRDGNRAILFLKTVPLFIFFVSLLHRVHMCEGLSRCYEHGAQSYHKISIWVVWVSYNSSFYFIMHTSRKMFNDCFDFCNCNAWHSTLVSFLSIPHMCPAGVTKSVPCFSPETQVLYKEGGRIKKVSLVLPATAEAGAKYLYRGKTVIN